MSPLSKRALCTLTLGVYLSGLPNALAEEPNGGSTMPPPVESAPVKPEPVPSPIPAPEQKSDQAVVDNKPETAAPSDATSSDSNPATAAPPEEQKDASATAKPKKGFTGISGVITDAKTKEALIEAQVKVIKGATKQALTDIDGKFSLKLPPGTYDLRVFYPLYVGRKIGSVEVRAGETTTLDVALEPDEKSVQEVVVEAKADTRKEAAVLQERKRAATVSDSISAQEISRSPDNNAGDAVKRVVSATVVGGKYVFLRGLGGRYSQALLNGVTLPSPEPDEQAVPLDMFPTSLLANLTVLKTYNPENPGTFAGGTLAIGTNAYPTQREWKLKLSLSGDSATTFRNIQSHEGGKYDWFGFQDGSRTMPSSVPRSGPLNRETVPDIAQYDAIGRSFSSNWATTTKTGMPNMSINGSVGDTVKLGPGQLGFLLSANFGHRESAYVSSVAKSRLGAPGEAEVMERDRQENQIGVSGGTLGALANLGYKVGQNHEIGLFSLYTHSGDARTVCVMGRNDDAGGLVQRRTRLQFVERALSFSQLRGEHRFSGLKNLQFDWQGNFSVTTRSEPDTRDLTYLQQADGSFRFRDESSSGLRFFSGLFDQGVGAGGGLTLPLSGVKFKVGGMVQNSSRTFAMRRIRVTRSDTADGNAYSAAIRMSPSEIFKPENIGSAFELREATLAEDSYKASLLVSAGYATADITALEPFRLTAGVRYEVATQELNPGSKYGLGEIEPRERTSRNEANVLPAVNATYALSEAMNLRSGYSYTVARPQFRELAPFFFPDIERNRSVQGNASLETTRIHNVDLRWEWFPTVDEVFSASAFYKKFEKPIERVITDAASGDLGLDNAEGANLYGLELEARSSLRRISNALRSLRAGVNISLINSQIVLREENLRSQTNKERPLQGQSPYVVNFNLSYAREEWGTEITALYNVSGARIAEVGVDKLPDVYERPFHRVDLAASKKLGKQFLLKITVGNLLNSTYRLQQGPLSIVEYKPGVSGGLSVEWTP